MSALLITGLGDFIYRVCPDAPGQRHEPGTWTRGRRLTGKKAIISLGVEQSDFNSGYCRANNRMLPEGDEPRVHLPEH